MATPRANSLGATPDIKRRKQAAELRARGLSFREIGKRLGISRQAAQVKYRYTLGIRPATIPKLPDFKCSQCGRTIPRRGKNLHTLPVCCLKCANTFGERLRSLRVAAGLSGPRLARLVGVTDACIGSAEKDQHKLRPQTVKKLLDMFGPKLLGRRPSA